MTTRRPAGATAKLAASLRMSMTMEEAREVLGFPPGYMPTEKELSKAVRQRARQAHPDLGGSNEQMVEINVAKEVLEGTRVNDRTEVGAAAKQRRLDLEAISAAKARAVAAMTPVTSRMHAALFPGWRLDLREWLIETYADQLDGLQDYAERAAKGASASDEHVLKEVDRYCTQLAGQALRVAAKLGSLSKRLTQDEQPTVSGLDRLCADFTKVIDQVFALHKTSKALIGLLHRTETVPFDRVDAFFGNHSMLDSFKGDFDRSGTRGNDCDLSDVSATVREAATSVLEILQRRGSQTASLPPWDQWDAAVFDQASSLVDRRTNASHRVAARYLARR